MGLTFTAVILWTFALVLRKGVCHSVVDPNPNPFDGGPINSCTAPSFSPGSICRDLVNYEVPSSVARLVNIVEDHINNHLEDGVSDECREAYRNTLCLQRFPRCEGNGTILLGEQSRTMSVSSECNTFIQSRTRNEEIRLPLDDTCRTIGEQTFEVSLNRCAVSAGQLMTPWMLEYIQTVDHTVRNENSVLYDPQHSSGCAEPLAFHLCNFIGKCSSDGVRVEYINSYESCSRTINW